MFSIPFLRWIYKRAVKSRNYALAVAILKTAIYLKAEPQLYYLLGLAYIKLEMTEKALGFLEEAIEGESSNENFYNAIAYVYRRRGDIDKSILYLDKALMINPNHCESLQDKAFCYMDLKEFSMAVEGFSKLLSLADCENVTGYIGLSASFGQLGHYDEVIDACTRGLDLDPECGDLYFNITNAFNAQERFTQTVEMYQKAKNIGVTDPDLDENFQIAMQELAERKSN